MLALLLPLGGAVRPTPTPNPSMLDTLGLPAAPAVPAGLAPAPTQGGGGNQPDPQVIAQFGLYNNPTLQRLIDEKGQQMNKVSDRPGNYGFTIVDSPMINAFATPQGHVYFTRGIMAHFNNEAQFAGVLGHEIGHITARHSAKQQTNAIIGQVGLMGAMIASPRLAQFGEQAMQGMQLLFLKFGRDDERQSDELGVQYSSAIGYDAAQMADFFQTLAREQGKHSQQAIPDFLSTHPNPEDRYTTVQQLAAEWQQKLPADQFAVGRDSYLRALKSKEEIRHLLGVVADFGGIFHA